MASSANSRKSVLVIEDDEDSRLALTALIQSGGYRAIGVSSAKEAVSHLYSSTLPDLIMLDLRLPGKGGEEFAKELHANPLFKNIPIIIVSGYVDSPISIANVKGTFEKPIDAAKLLDALKSFL